jgi:hypothetical protein
MPKAAKGLTISRRSNGSFRAQIRKVGFPYQTKDFLTLRDADAWGMARLAEMEAGDAVDRRSAKRTTFGDTINQYLLHGRRNELDGGPSHNQGQFFKPEVCIETAAEA